MCFQVKKWLNNLFLLPSLSSANQRVVPEVTKVVKPTQSQDWLEVPYLVVVLQHLLRLMTWWQVWSVYKAVNLRQVIQGAGRRQAYYREDKVDLKMYQTGTPRVGNRITPYTYPNCSKVFAEDKIWPLYQSEWVLSGQIMGTFTEGHRKF